MRKLNAKKYIFPNSGFTMIELAIVMIIFGLIVIPLLQAYGRYQAEVKYYDTRTRVEDSIDQIKIFRANNFASPCPANAALSINDPNYGLEDCNPAYITMAPGCIAGGGICKIAGARDTTDDVDTIAGNNSEFILVGAYPFRSIAQTNQIKSGIDSGLDAWGNKLTYAVSARTTTLYPHDATSSGEDFKFGVIQAVDEFDNNTAGTNRDAQHVVLSHGPTGGGARSAEGRLVAACSAAERDRENCNGDAKFMRSISYYEGAGAGFYDDYAYFYKGSSGDLWVGITSGDSVTGAIGSMATTVSNNVGVNTASTTPSVKLDVAGTMRATTTLTNEICDSNNTNCIPLQFLWSPVAGAITTTQDNLATPTVVETISKTWRNYCPTGSFARALANGQMQCVSSVTIPPPPGGAAVECPGTGNYIVKILTNGCFICTDGFTYPTTGCPP